MLPKGPVSPVRRRRAFFDRGPQVRGAPARIVGRAGPPLVGVWGAARACGRNAQYMRVEPFGAAPADAPGIGRVAQLDTVDAAVCRARVQRAEGTLADREREVGER